MLSMSNNNNDQSTAAYNSNENKTLRRNLGLDVPDDNPALYGDLPKALRNGVINTNMQAGLKFGLVVALLAVLGVAAFTVTSFVSVPAIAGVLINAWFTGSVIYLSGLTYGIINDIIGCKRNLPYFSLGHQPQQQGLIESNDPTTVGIAWGIFATAPLATIAAVIFMAAALITGLIGLPFAGFALPVIGILIPATLAFAHHYSLKQEKKYREAPDHEDFYGNKESELKGIKNVILHHPKALNSYQKDRLKYWLKTDEDVNKWLSNSARNMIGFIALPLVAISGLAAMITLTCLPHLLPALCFSAALSVFPPLGLGLMLSVLIISAGFYLYANHQKIVDTNPYRLDFPKAMANEEVIEDKQESIHSPSLSPSNSTTQVIANLPALEETVTVEQANEVSVSSNKSNNNSYSSVMFPPPSTDTVDTPVANEAAETTPGITQSIV